jgi:Post-segregation antitoxin CcdA/Phage-integrase repeat unit
VNKEYQPFELAREFTQKLGLKSAGEWNTYCKSRKKPQDIPFNPNKVYRQRWISWGDWLGTGRIANANKTFKSFEDAREFVRSLGLKSQKEWVEYYKSKKKPSDIPSHAHIVYKDSWRGFGDWLGTDAIAPQKRQYLPFEEARRHVRSLRLKGYKEWIDYCKSGRKPVDIPTSPQVVYKNKGWKAWGDWLGYKSTFYETNYSGPKQKLTLSLSKEIIKRAKSRNINISALTENLLSILTYDPTNGSERKEVTESYEALFDSIRQLLKNYTAKVEIGRLHDVSENDSDSSLGSPILLDSSGLSLLSKKNLEQVSTEEVLHDIYNPIKILENTIQSIIEASDKDKQRTRELRLALRLVRSLSEDKELQYD